MRIRQLGLKVSLLVTLMIAVMIAIIFYIVSAGSDDLVAQLTAREAKASNAMFANALEEYKTEAQMRASIIALSPGVIDSLAANTTSADVSSADGGAALRAELQDLMQGVDLITVCDTDGTVVARGHSDQTGDNVYAQTAIAAALETGNGITTIEKGTAVGLSTRASAAIRGPDGAIIGAVTCGHDLSLPKYVDAIKAANNSEATLFDGDTRLSTTLTNESGQREVGSKASDAVVAAVIDGGQDYSMPTELFGSYYAAYYSPLTVDGRVIGMLFTGINYDSVRADRQTMLDSVLLAAILAGLACALLTFVYGIFAIGGPLKKIGAFADRIRSGDLGFSTPSDAVIDVRSSDEAGTLARVLEQSYLQLRGYVGEIRERMQGLSDGDLVTESAYEFRGDFIMIKDAINGIIRTLNRIMGEVGGSSEQVSMAATHVADGAQLLAQGSTEQASTIETLSASISEINEQTGRNAGVAKEATVLSGSIRDSAEKGETQMERMMKAIGDINEASEKISKVISVIDDIAFQTNILALNAAVEAASAGQHGKGFAVVAAEVRRLAAKCAAAASDTNELIVDSVTKSNYGLEIATETSKSLKEIVEGINRSAAIIAQIAVSSEAQAKSIGDISDGIGQVAQVIQQNSAAAEESAAASQEMNAQSSLLLQLMSHFDIESARGDTRGTATRALETGN